MEPLGCSRLTSHSEVDTGAERFCLLKPGSPGAHAPSDPFDPMSGLLRRWDLLHWNEKVAGSIPASSSLWGAVAQLAEHLSVRPSGSQARHPISLTHKHGSFVGREWCGSVANSGATSFNDVFAEHRFSDPLPSLKPAGRTRVVRVSCDEGGYFWQSTSVLRFESGRSGLRSARRRLHKVL